MMECNYSKEFYGFSNGFKLLKLKSKDEGEGILKKNKIIWNNNIHPINNKTLSSTLSME